MARPAYTTVKARLITDADGDEIYVYHCPHCNSPHRDTVAYPHITCQSERCYKPFSIIYPGLPDDPNPHQHPEINEELVTHELNSHSEGLPHKTGSGLPIEQDKHDPLPSHDYLREALLGRYGADQQRIAEVGLDWVKTLLAKNSDYGSTVWDSPKLAPYVNPGIAILTRMSDKIDRLINLSKKNGPQVHTESYDDTINDLGAYCLLYLARPNREKPMTPDEVVKTFMQNTNPLRFDDPKSQEVIKEFQATRATSLEPPKPFAVIKDNVIMPTDGAGIEVPAGALGP